MKLIIAEKPSLAQNIANAIGGMKNKGSYFENEDYLVVGAFGHLYELDDLNNYLGLDRKAKWEDVKLPFKPENFEFNFIAKDDDGVKKRIELINELINDGRVREIINCGDSDREGQIIVRLIINKSTTSKPIYRLWLPDQTQESILKGLDNLKQDSEYDNLANEGFARMYIDWLYGINYTRYATLKCKSLMNVGRVITPIIYAIYKRDMEIKDFVPTAYIDLEGTYNKDDKELKFSVIEKIEPNEKERYVALLANLNDSMMKVVSKEIKEVKKQSPKLFSQSKLQNHLSKLYKYKPSKTLEICQSLYEEGLLSYPRTNTEYLATSEANVVDSLIIGRDELVNKDTKRIYDDSKIESHSALIPTRNAFKDNLGLNTDEKQVLDEVINRFNAVFCKEECILEETKYAFNILDYNFEKKGFVVKQLGYKKFISEKEENQLPNFDVDEEFKVNFAFVDKISSPPKKYTIETLNNYLKTPFKKEEVNESDDEEYKEILSGSEIGTEATRPMIIDKAIAGGYIELDKQNYGISEKGMKYIEALDELDVKMSVELIAKTNAILKDVYHNKVSVVESLQQIFSLIEETINKDNNTNIQFENTNNSEKIATCSCGGSVLEKGKVYKCDKCDLVIFKDNKFLENGKKKLTKKMVKDLVENKRCKVTGLTSKAGKKYDVDMILVKEGQWYNVKADFK